MKTLVQKSRHLAAHFPAISWFGGHMFVGKERSATLHSDPVTPDRAAGAANYIWDE
jgi:hypothetical protein